MALIKCLECGREISDKAISCPNCGRPIKIQSPYDVVTDKQPQKQKRVNGCLVAFLIIVFSLLFFMILGGLFFSIMKETQNKDNVEREESVHENIDDGIVKWGYEGNTGSLSLKINSVIETEKIEDGNGYLVYKPDSGKYAVINVTLRNVTKKSEHILLNQFGLIGPDDARYVPTIIPGIDDKYINVDVINPNLDITGNIVFEIPKELDVQECVLVYLDGNIDSKKQKYEIVKNDSE